MSQPGRWVNTPVIGARDASKHPTIHRTVCTLVKNVCYLKRRLEKWRMLKFLYPTKRGKLCFLPKLVRWKIPYRKEGSDDAKNKSHYRQISQDFPGGPVVKNLPCNARDSGSTPGQGTKIPHAMQQLSPSSTTTEPAHHN